MNSLSGGELFERITAEGYTMSEAEVINYMRQICEGVKHMHEKNIIHLGECPAQDHGLLRGLWLLGASVTCSLRPVSLFVANHWQF